MSANFIQYFLILSDSKFEVLVLKTVEGAERRHRRVPYITIIFSFMNEYFHLAVFPHSSAYNNLNKIKLKKDLYCQTMVYNGNNIMHDLAMGATARLPIYH